MNKLIDANEPILQDKNNYTILPIQYEDIYLFYKKAISCFWIEEEINLANDIKDWETLSAEDKWFISHILAFFSGADGLVSENLATRFYTDVPIPEVRLFYGFQIAMEGIHQEVYAKLIDTYIKDKEEKHKLFDGLNQYPCIKQKGEWCKKYLSCSCPFAVRLVAFAIVEGIFFSGAFCSIFWLKSRNKLPGLCFSNELISRDEALHTEFAVMLYSKLLNKIPEANFIKQIKEAVQIEIDFICDALPCRLIGMNSKMMTEYIQFVADRLCLQLGYSKIYNSKNPFGFMELISLESKSNFFEKKVSDYGLANKEGIENFDFENLIQDF